MPAKRANGEGSVYKTSDGKWKAALTLHRPDGTPYRRTFTARTRAQALARAAAFRTADAPPAAPLAVNAYLDDWLSRRTPALARTTALSYRYRLQSVRAGLGDVPLADLTPRMVQALWMQLEQSSYAPGTITGARTVLGMALRDAVADGLLTTNPAARTSVTRAERSPRRVLSVDEARHLLAVAEAGADPLWPLWAVFLRTGMRMGEALGLRWADIDTAARRFTITQQLQRDAQAHLWYTPRPKTARARRTLPLVPSALRALAVQRDQQTAWRQAAPVWQASDLVFTRRAGQPWHQADIRYHFRRALARAGLPPIRPHDLRHTVATLLLKEGVAMAVISALLGHASIGITADIYTQVDVPLLEEAVGRLEKT